MLLRLQQHKEEVMKNLHLLVMGQRGQFYKQKEVYQQLKTAFEEIGSFYEWAQDNKIKYKKILKYKQI